MALLFGLAASATAGDIHIVTEPEGAEVWIGTVRLGTTNKGGLRISTPYSGSVALTIRMEGFESEQQTVKVDVTSAPATVLVRLRPLTGARPAAPNPPSSSPVPVPSPQTDPAPSVAKGASAPAPGTQSGGHKGLILGIIGTAAAGTAVGVVVAKHQAGCPDNSDPSVSSGGPFTITVVPDLTGQVNCNTPTQPITIAGTNLGCSPVEIQSANITASPKSGPCTGGGFSRSLKVIASTVPSGGRNVPIAGGVIGNSLAGCCLNGGSCGTSSFQCDESEVYTVQTSKGPVTSSNSYTILFSAGFSCVPCDLSSSSCRGPAPP